MLLEVVNVKQVMNLNAVYKATNSGLHSKYLIEEVVKIFELLILENLFMFLIGQLRL
jgi:hypothetical protein